MHTRTIALLFAIAACSRRDAGRTTDSAAGDVAIDPPTRAARLTSIDGPVSLEAAGSRTWTRPTNNYTVTTGDRLYASPNGRAALDLGDGAIRLDHGGDLSVTSLTDSFTQLGLDQGAIEASLYRYDDADSLEFDTPNGALVPTEAGTYIVSVEPNDGGTVVSVERGALDVTGPGLDQTLNAGQTVRLVGTNPIQIVALGSSYTRTEPVISDLDSWRGRDDRLYSDDRYSSRYVSRSIPGWEDLDDNGVWFTDASNTEVWCPTRVTRTWVPYREGHWSWVGPWGWTWVDDAPWGYAPFHYGRWETVTSSACASSWAWVPGPIVSQPVWAPALVAFVAGDALGFGTPSVEGWFPLGPSEPYFPWYRYRDDDYLREVNVTNLIEVRDVDPLLRDRDFSRLHWVNRERALTAVPAAAFAAGDRVAGRELHVRPDRVQFATVTMRPSARPRNELMTGGRAVESPRFAHATRAVVTRKSARDQEQRVATGGPIAREPGGAARGTPIAPPAGVRERPAPVIAKNQIRGERPNAERSAGGEVAIPRAPSSRGKNAAPPRPSEDWPTPQPRHAQPSEHQRVMRQPTVRQPLPQSQPRTTPRSMPSHGEAPRMAPSRTSPSPAPSHGAPSRPSRPPQSAAQKQQQQPQPSKGKPGRPGKPPGGLD